MDDYTDDGKETERYYKDEAVKFDILDCLDEHYENEIITESMRDKMEQLFADCIEAHNEAVKAEIAGE